MDAAAAAAMSDPERNTKFRRRWQDHAARAAVAPPADPARGRGRADRARAARGVAPRAGAPRRGTDVNARTGATPSRARATEPTYGFTFGVYNQDTPWTDVRALSWPELVGLLTRHRTGPKKGTCIAPAVFSGDRRGNDYARRIDVAFLDSDAGPTLREIRAAIAERGWAAVVSSTHSHLSTRTRARRAHWDKFRVAAGRRARPPRFLRREKGYLPRIAEGARLAEETGEFVVFEHAPCPKFRVAIPLLRPWRAEDYADRRAANAAWKEAVEALAAALRLDHDQSCTDTSRLFFLPRRPPGGPPPETAVLDGAPATSSPCRGHARTAPPERRPADGALSAAGPPLPIRRPARCSTWRLGRAARVAASSSRRRSAPAARMCSSARPRTA